MIKHLLISFALVASVAGTAAASPEYKCSGDRVEKGGGTKFQIRRSGSGFSIEKGGSTKAQVVKRGSSMAVEVGGSTKATIANGKIEKGGSSWGTASDAQRQFECDDTVASALWVLFKLDILP